ncbi:hypothetical protein [Kribbella kalugense]|uniref:Mom family adenine methylcarbamoylation protein n=1 Tax=Kribbella kalugense TaxID=2512221 RepID=UPI001064E31A|nr:hypothetical protein [Kribbella kalugense]
MTLAECRSTRPAFAELVEGVAGLRDVPKRTLSVRTLLHLPRLAGPGGAIRRSDVIAELRLNANRLQTDHQAIAHLVPNDEIPLADLHFVELGRGVADQIFSRLHYLRSARSGSLNFALVDPVHRRPVTLCSVSLLEWARVARQLRTQFDVPPDSAWEVSRVYSFAVAPTNAISFLLAKVRQALRAVKDASVMTTAVDPNLGFGGASYRAANWQRWMSVQARPYLYVDGMYASPRQLRLRFGGANLSDLRRANPANRFEQSRVPLLDSWIFCCRLDGTTETIPPEGQRRLRR